MDLGVWCVSLRAWMRGAKAPRDDLTIWRYRVDVIPYLPKCPVPGRCYTELTEVSGTGIDVVPIPVPTPVQASIPVPEVPVLMSYRTCRSVGYRY